MSHTLFDVTETYITTIFPDAASETPIRSHVRQQLLSDQMEMCSEDEDSVCYDL